MSRTLRARPIVANQHHRLRKRYAALVAALLIPAIAGAAEWPAPAPAVSLAASHIQLAKAAFTQPFAMPAIHSDAQDHALADDAAAIGPSARTFFAAGSGLDHARAEQCLTMAIYYEAATQPDDGQRAVAQVVLNRVAHPSFPNTVCGVVFQGSERSTGCQFTFTCDGSLARRPSPVWWDRARRAAQSALSGAVFAPIGLATHYHTMQVHPAWSDALIHVATIGAHQFFRLPGAAGQPAAFRVAYFGGEPAAAPRPHLFTPAIDSDQDPILLARAFDATAARTVMLNADHRAASRAPVFSAEVEARGGEALFQAENLPASGALSPELERSGRWLQQP